MANVSPVILSDEESEELQEADPPNLEHQLDQFREQWQQELSKNKGQVSNNQALKPKFVSIEEEATSLFIQGAQAEQNGELYVAIGFYKKAIQLVPDIESRIDFRKMRTPRDRQDSECSVESKTDEDEDLLLHLQNLSVDKHAICEPKLEQNSTHISELPIEVIMYILKWVVSSELDTRSLEMFSQVCHGFYLCARDEELWKLICHKIWGQNCGKLKKYGCWRKMYIDRPHVLFNGCYISKSTYYRTGEKSLDGFYRPYHVVEYYRFIRMYPDGVILMTCSPDDPQMVLPKLRYKSNNVTGLLKGHYRLTGNKITAEMTRSKTNETGYYKYKRRQVNNHNQIDVTYFVELEVNSGGKGIHNILNWSKYSIATIRSGNKENVSDVDLNKQSFPPMIFSRVKSFCDQSEQLLV
ncbi:hypothetical protein SNE40_022107 [Patella caerulea]|uniref:F-box only protein 9 n=1 Tax=Patella caerulea TaxID=87958 RepID=A0AAN8GJH3_PATCE